jgi:hypothetical protein
MVNENISRPASASLVVILMTVAVLDSPMPGLEAATWEDAKWQ